MTTEGMKGRPVMQNGPFRRSWREIVVLVLVVLALGILRGSCLAGWLERQEPLAHAVYVPEGYDAKKQYPLVISIHGNGQQGSDNRIYKIAHYPKLLSTPEMQKKFPHFIYVPQCPRGQRWVGSSWGKGSYSVDKVPVSSSMQKLTDILSGLVKEFSIDADRIYVIGISMGGQATWDLLCRHPGMFAGAVPMCGCGDPSKAADMTGTGIWAFHGSRDRTIPVSGSRDMMEGLEKAGMEVLRLHGDPKSRLRARIVYSEYDVGHGVWNNTFQVDEYLVPWLFAQARGNHKKP
jgi:predicted peptidase